MAAPSPTARSMPTGYKLPDGFKTTIVSGLRPAVNLWEKTVKPPGIDGGEAIDTTTMLNSIWRTFAHKHLMTLTEITFTAAYDPNVYPDLLFLINKDDTCTVHFPDHASIAYYAFWQKIEFDENKEGEFPSCTVTVTATNWDPVNQVEAGPTYTPGTGTGTS